LQQAQAPLDSEKFARLPPGGRVWAVASIHGEAQRLARLHDMLGGRLQPGDRLVYLGNYLGHGASVAAALDELLEFRCGFLARPFARLCDLAYLRGSQEEMWHKLLQLQFAPNPREVLQWMLDHGLGPTLQAYGGDPAQGFGAAREGAVALTRWTAALRSAFNAAPGHANVMSALRRAAFTEDRRLLFVNAGIDVARPLSVQGDSFWWGGRGFLELDRPYDGFVKVVRGFDPAKPGVSAVPHALSIDGGSGRGGTLLALCLDAEGGVLDRIET
jgi:serine/threonine protein phosphatase 1